MISQLLLISLVVQESMYAGEETLHVYPSPEPFKINQSGQIIVGSLLKFKTIKSKNPLFDYVISCKRILV